MANVFTENHTGAIVRRTIHMPGTGLDHEAERNRIEADRRRDARLIAERNAKRARAEQDAVAVALEKAVDRILIERLAPQFAELGDIDAAFANWKKTKAYKLAGLESAGSAAESVLFAGVEVAGRVVEDHVVAEVAAVARLKALSSIERSA